jgi:putative flippase GtrA
MVPPPSLTKLLRFAIAGLLATLVHVITAAVLIETKSLGPAPANGVAFVTALLFSYVLNTKWSFSTRIARDTLFRFAAVSAAAGSVAAALSGAVEYYGLHYSVGIAVVVCIVPPLTFLMHNFWTYR